MKSALQWDWLIDFTRSAAEAASRESPQLLAHIIRLCAGLVASILLLP